MKYLILLVFLCSCDFSDEDLSKDLGPKGRNSSSYVFQNYRFTCREFTHPDWVKLNGFSLSECEQHVYSPKYKEGQRVITKETSTKTSERLTIGASYYYFYDKNYDHKRYFVTDSKLDTEDIGESDILRRVK